MIDQRVLLLLVATLGLVFNFASGVPVELQPGSCPPPVARRVCIATCDVDEDCPDALLCCGTMCGGSLCVRPVTAAAAASGPYGRREKSGTCPTSQSTPWICSHRCRTDYDCAGESKCCPSKCGGMMCLAPSELSIMSIQ